MASPLVFRTPECLSCIRRISGNLGKAFQLPNAHQIRGKRKMAKVATVNVHLLCNIPGHGRRGAVIPVTAGMMRNIWYPNKMAEYLTAAKVQELSLKKDAIIERDFTFKSRPERKAEKERQAEAEAQAIADAEYEAEYGSQPVAPVQVKEEQLPKIELKVLSPAEATSILEEVLPANIDFYRTPITITVPKRVSPSIPAASFISSDAAVGAAGREHGKAGKTSIYGSVSLADIAINLKALLAETDNGARVSLSPEEISFVEETEDKDRVKYLGIFEIEIRLVGSQDSVRRTIQIHAQS